MSKIQDAIQEVQQHMGDAHAKTVAKNIYKNVKVAAERNKVRESDLENNVVESILSGDPISSSAPYTLARQMNQILNSLKSGSDEKPLRQMNKAQLVEVALKIEGVGMTEDGLKELKNAELVKLIEDLQVN